MQCVLIYYKSIVLFFQSFNLFFNGSIPDLTISQFVQFITDEDVPEKFHHDRHLEPFSHSCGFCNITYDYILRLETPSDASPVLKLLGYPQDFLSKDFIIHRKQSSVGGDMKSRYIHEFRDVPKALMDKLLNRYQHDLELFGYQYNRDTLETGCSIKTQSGQICC